MQEFRAWAQSLWDLLNGRNRQAHFRHGAQRVTSYIGLFALIWIGNFVFRWYIRYDALEENYLMNVHRARGCSLNTGAGMLFPEECEAARRATRRSLSILSLQDTWNDSSLCFGQSCFSMFIGDGTNLLFLLLGVGVLIYYFGNNLARLVFVLLTRVDHRLADRERLRMEKTGNANVRIEELDVSLNTR